MLNKIDSKLNGEKIRGIKSFLRTKSLLALTLTMILMAVACGGGGITEEQLKELEETKTAALSAEQKIQESKATKKTLSGNLSAKKKELNQLLADKKLLVKRLKDLENLNTIETEADTSVVDTNDVDSSNEDNGDGR